MIEVRVERWAELLPEATELFPLHWAEIAVNRDKYAPSIDYERYAHLDQLGMLHCLAVRADGKLVGYCIAFIISHMHYREAGPFALTDMYYIRPECRNGAGARMFVEFERTLKARGVVVAHTSCKVQQDHTAMLEALGWSWTDKTFTKYLGK